MRKVFKYIWSGWKKVAHGIARIQTNLLITIFYFLVLTPLGLVFKLFGWDPLESRLRNLHKTTNWKSVDRGEPNLEAMRRQS